jgi:hypothetical protein
VKPRRGPKQAPETPQEPLIHYPVGKEQARHYIFEGKGPGDIPLSESEKDSEQ